MDLELVKLVQQTGFTQKEALVYVALLELGQADVTDMAKLSGLKRSTIYVLLDGLIEKGHVSQMKDKKVNTYQAIDPAVIYSRIKSTSKLLGEMLPYLQSLRNKGKKKPRMHFIETLEGIWKVYEEILFFKEGIFISSYARIESYFPGAIETFVRQKRKGVYKMQGRHLIPNNEKDIQKGKMLATADQKVRILSAAASMNMDFAIFNNKIALTLLEEEPFMVLIESEELAKSLTPIFEIAWQSGKEIS